MSNSCECRLVEVDVEGHFHLVTLYFDEYELNEHVGIVYELQPNQFYQINEQSNEI